MICTSNHTRLVESDVNANNYENETYLNFRYWWNLNGIFTHENILLQFYCTNLLQLIWTKYAIFICTFYFLLCYFLIVKHFTTLKDKNINICLLSMVLVSLLLISDWQGHIHLCNESVLHEFYVNVCWSDLMSTYTQF